MYIVYPVLTIIQVIGIVLLYMQDYKNLALFCFITFFIKVVILDDKHEVPRFVLASFLTVSGVWAIGHYDFVLGVVACVVIIIAVLVPKIPLRNY